MARCKYGTHVKPRIPEIQKWIRENIPEKIIAARLGVAYSSFRLYKDQHPELCTAVKEAHQLPIAALENSMHKMANGHYVEEIKPFKLKNTYYDDRGKKVEEEMIQEVTVNVYHPPIFAAAAFLLNNLAADRYRLNANKEMLDREKFEHQKDQDKYEW